MVVNVSRRTGWVRLFLAIACLAALAWALSGLLSHQRSAYHNLSYQEPAIYYAILACLLVTFLAALVGLISGVAGVRHPGDAPGWLFNLVLGLLLAGTLYSAVVAQGYIAYLD